MDSSYELDREILKRAIGSKEYQEVVNALSFTGGKKHNFRFNTTKEFRASLTTLSKTIEASFVKMSLAYFHQETFIIYGKEGKTLSKLYNTLNSYHANINQNAYLIENWSQQYIKKKYNRFDKDDRNYDLYISTSEQLSDLSKAINSTIDLFFGQLVLHTEAKKINSFVNDKLAYQYANYDDCFFFSYSEELWEALKRFKYKYNIPIRNIISYSFENINVFRAKNLINYAREITSESSKKDLKNIINKIQKDSEILNDTTKSFHIMNMDGELTTDIILLMNKNISNSVKLYTKINKDLKRIIDNEINNNR
ncbi:hypothetical protein CFI10_11500 [Marinobacterium iners]|uniref:hypothetical protein n=1 Tax=Marinobacterium iners TaxID=48076 RepID=UPI001A8DE77C|nr:hypothetical protein [Marinobacterium iners]QSR35614.1 hypothetical protein CFI10_11500 [Marinobacterium iners]